MFEALFEKRKQQAQAGRQLWLAFVEEFQIGTKEYILLLPPKTHCYHEPALKHLDEFLNKKQSERAIVLYVAEAGVMSPDQIQSYSKKICEVREISEENYQELIRFYCLYEFTDRMIIASLEEPDGRLGKNMVGHKGLTLEEAVKVTLYD